MEITRCEGLEIPEAQSFVNGTFLYCVSHVNWSIDVSTSGEPLPPGQLLKLVIRLVLDKYMNRLLLNKTL
jgi:hypothetical protein